MVSIDYRDLIHPPGLYQDTLEQLSDQSPDDMRAVILAGEEMLREYYLPHYAYKRTWLLDNEEYAKILLETYDESDTLIDELKERFYVRQTLQDPKSDELRAYLNVENRPFLNPYPDDPYQCFLLWRTWEAEWRIDSLFARAGWAMNKHSAVHEALAEETWRLLFPYLQGEPAASRSVKASLCLLLMVSNWRLAQAQLECLKDPVYQEWLAFYLSAAQNGERARTVTLGSDGAH